MAGPFPTPGFLAALSAGLPEPTLDMPADTVTPTGAKLAAPPAVYNAPAGQEWQPTDPLAGVKETNAPGVGVLAGYDPLKGDAPAPTRDPVSFTRGDAPSSAAPGIQPMPDDVQFRPVSIPGAPAREVPVRGPKQNALIDRSYIGPEVMADRVAERSTAQAERESAMYDAQANEALERQAAMERMMARRQQELQMMRNDYLETIDRLGKMKVDNNRAWDNASTMDKIGATLLVVLGSFGNGGDQSKNLPLQAVMGKINEDVENQKRAYDLGLNVAKGQQTAYSMAMEQYGSEDAAYHAAMAAGQQAVAAKIAGMNAQWKGTNAQNAADGLRGELLMKADQQRADGLRYLQPTGGGTKYKMVIRGQEVPGLVDESKAQGYAVEHGVKPSERVDEKLVEGGIQSKLQNQKLAAEQRKDTKRFEVVLPNGEVLAAPSEKVADKARVMATSVMSTRSTFARARKLRSGVEWAVPGSPDRATLESLQSDLVTEFKNAKELGAISESDMKLAIGAVGDITERSPAAMKRLETYVSKTEEGLRNYLKTVPGAPEKSSGVMPAGFEAKR